MPSDLMDTLQTQIINVADRREGGADRSMRIEVLQFLSGMQRSRYLYVVHRAAKLEALRAVRDRS